MTRYRYPAYVDGFVDMDYWADLSPADRKWLQQFSAEYYADHFTKKPLHNTPELRAECSRRYSQARRDAAPFASDLEIKVKRNHAIVGRHNEDTTTVSTWSPLLQMLCGTVHVDLDLERPEVKKLLSQIRKLRPEGDPTDSRKKLRFRSALHESRFYTLRERLHKLLNKGDGE